MKKTFDIWPFLIEEDMTTSELAKKAGITVRSLQNYMAGREPRLDVVLKIAEVFDVSIDQLFVKK